MCCFCRIGKKISKAKGILDTWRCAVALVYGSEDMEFTSIQGNGKKLPVEQSTGTLLSCTDMRRHPVFNERSCTILEGEFIEKNDQNQAVITDSNNVVFDHNNHVIGDMFHVRAENQKEIELQVKGFSSDPGNQGWPWSSNSVNFVFTDECTVLEAQEEKGYREVRYLFDTAEHVDDFADKIAEMDLPEYEEMEVVLDTTEYTQVKSSYESLYHVMIITILFVLFLACLIVGLVMIYMTVGRKREIGILLSMGEARGKIWIQLITEVLVPMIIAEILAVLVTVIFIPKTSSLILGETIPMTVVTVGVSWQTICYMTLCNMILIAVVGLLIQVIMSGYPVKTLLEDV